LYGACSGIKKILAWDLKTAAAEVVAEGFASNDLVVLHNGSIYITDPASRTIWHVDPATHKARAVDEFPGCNGITASLDQAQLYVAHFPGRSIYRYRIAADGQLNDKQSHFQLQLAANTTESHADGMCVSAEGWLLSATEAGIQVCDAAGRVHQVLPKPGTGRRVCYVRMHEQTLYAATADAVWKRKVKLTAAKPFEAPLAPPRKGP
jgi:sugar lactone lactonase YvrE